MSGLRGKRRWRHAELASSTYGRSQCQLAEPRGFLYNKKKEAAEPDLGSARRKDAVAVGVDSNTCRRSQPGFQLIAGNDGGKKMETLGEVHTRDFRYNIQQLGEATSGIGWSLSQQNTAETNK